MTDMVIFILAELLVYCIFEEMRRKWWGKSFLLAASVAVAIKLIVLWILIKLFR